MNQEFNPFTEFESQNFGNLIQPLKTDDFSTYLIDNLYREEQLTRDEYLVLDFIGINSLHKSGSLIMSFQGIKRLTSIHQARLTKAINRLIRKDFLEKVDGGYMLTKIGSSAFSRLLKQQKHSRQLSIKTPFSHVSTGQIQGPLVPKEQKQKLVEYLAGRWFGKYRFTTKIEYKNSCEICWISTDESISISLLLGPDNNLRLSLSTPIQSIAQKELQLLIDHISQTLEGEIDAPVIFNSYSISTAKTDNIHYDEGILFPYAG